MSKKEILDFYFEKILFGIGSARIFKQTIKIIRNGTYKFALQH